MVQPIRPCDVKLIIPDFIIEAVNQLIKEKWDGNEATIMQTEILSKVCSSDRDSGKPTRSEVFKRHWLDFENLYREQGWDVTYDRASYAEEDFEPYFTFKSKK